MTRRYVKLVRIGISRYYGFVDASFVEIAYVYGNGKQIKGSKHDFLGAYRHSTEGVEYAKFCGINSEADLYKIEGKLVNITFDADEYGRELIGLGKPAEFTKNTDYTGRYYYFLSPVDSDEIDWDKSFVIGNSY